MSKKKKKFGITATGITMLSASALLLGSMTLEAQNSKAKKPNILVILGDDIGYSDLGCFGSEISTPNLDRLGNQGIRFTHFYNTARCSPSRASLLTGVYPHQAEMGHLSSNNFPEPGYRDDLNRNAVTMAELFHQAGYATYMTGKWHLAKDMTATGDQSNWPRQRGFDRFFGTLNGSGSFYDPGTLTSNNTFVAPGKNFYYTDAISDTTVKFIRQHPKGKPFFCYVAYTAAHWPLHAPEKEVAKYKGKYDIGWDSLRAIRFKKLQKLGIIGSNCVLSDRSVEVPEWKNEPMKAWQLRRMEVYAAMIDVMDQGIGRIISVLEEREELENTAIFYMQDNGGCAEPQGSDKPEVPPTAEQLVLKPTSYDVVNLNKKPPYTREGRFVRSGRGVMAGPADAWMAYGPEWANVSNTPYRLYKQYTHEGGIATPLIVHWPAGIRSKGSINPQLSHLMDILPTCIDLAGISYPKKFNGKEIIPVEGKSLLPAFAGKQIDRELMFWEHSGNRAIRKGAWKLVSRVAAQMKFAAGESIWELYNLENDPSETTNLAQKFPGKVKEMADLWEAEALRTKAKPWPWDEQ
jgi:arylsulfatase A-like enzyme